MQTIDLSYKKGNMCGGCLHHKGAHAFESNIGCYRCNCCKKFCDPTEFDSINKSTNAKQKKEAAPIELTGV